MKEFLSWIFLAILAVANWAAVFYWGFGVPVVNWWIVIGNGVIATVLIISAAEALRKEGEGKK